MDLDMFRVRNFKLECDLSAKISTAWTKLPKRLSLTRLEVYSQRDPSDQWRLVVLLDLVDPRRMEHVNDIVKFLMLLCLLLSFYV